ncbi:MAG: hypothetical protein RLZZ271_1346, partial [Pseudomonadota bacterium]
MSGATTGSVVEDAASSVVTGKLNVSDRDAGQAGTRVISSASGTYGTFTVDANGNWRFTLDNSRSSVQALSAGEKVTDCFVVYSIDGTACKTVTVTITGGNDVAVISGTATGAVTENAATNYTTGKLTVSDADAGEASLNAQSNTNGTYGRFTIDASGNWKYTLDNSRSQTQALTAGQVVTES